jgi:predicted ABC-type transport system involved in lysophospholipase L1 biosynthesis ATPase subunit
MPTLVLDDGSGERRLDLALNCGQRYRAIVARPALKAQLMRKLGETAPLAIVAARGGLIGNLKVWENLILPIAYSENERGAAPLDQLEARAESLFRELGVLRERFAELCALLPDRLSEFERRLTAFVRAMLAEPEIIVYDGLFDGLSRAEIDKAARFDRLFRLHFPFRTALYVDAEDPMLPALRAYPMFHL